MKVWQGNHREQLNRQCVCVSQGRDKAAVYFDNVSGSAVPSNREDTKQHCCLNGKQTPQCHRVLPRRGMWPFLPRVTFAVMVLVCLSGPALVLTTLPPAFPLCSNKHHDKLPTPLTFSFFLFLTLLFPSGVRGTNNAGGFRCGTCWWRRCRGSRDTRCCCGILRRGARRRMRSGACRLLQSKWTHLYVSYMTPSKATATDWVCCKSIWFKCLLMWASLAVSSQKY